MPAFEACRVTADHADHQHFFGRWLRSSRLLDFNVRYARLGTTTRRLDWRYMIIITSADARAFIQFKIKVQVTLARLTATLAALGTFVPCRHADRWQVVLIKLRIFMGWRIQHP